MRTKIKKRDHLNSYAPSKTTQQSLLQQNAKNFSHFMKFERMDGEKNWDEHKKAA